MSESFEREYYASNYGNYDAQNPSRKLRFYARMIEKHAPREQSRRIHDIGCAFGKFLRSLDSEWEIVGSDVSQFATEKARKDVPRGEFSVADAHEIPADGKPFTAVSAFDVLEHVPNLSPVADAVNAQLVDAGVFVFVVPVYDGLSGPIIRALDRDPTHVHKWTRQRWLDWASSHFELLEWQGVWRYLLPGRFYLHLPTRLLRRHSPAIIVACRKKSEVTYPRADPYSRGMNNRPLGRTGFSVSALGFGAAPIGFLKTDIDRVGTILNLLLDSGVNLIDTAASYPGSEEAIAQTVGHRRGEFVIVSKCGQKLEGIEGEAWSAELIARTIDRSLTNLKIDRIDVMLLHSCDLETLKKGEAIGALVKARDAGKIAHAGYSGDNEAVAWAAAHPEIAVIETSINIADQVNIDMALPIAEKKNVGVLAKRPIANAGWKDINQQPGMYKDYASTYTERLAKMKLDPRELGMPDDSNDSWSELALRFTLSFPAVTTAIVGTTNPMNAKANIATAEKGPLPKDVIAKIRNVFQRANRAREWTGEQ